MNEPISANSQSIRTRLLAPLVVLVAMFGIMAAYASWIYITKYAALKKQISIQFQVNAEATDLMRVRALIQEDLLLYRITKEPEYKREIDDLNKRRSRDIEQIAKFGSDRDLWWVLSKSLLRGLDELDFLQTNMIESINAGDTKSADRIFTQLATIYAINTARIKDLTERLQTELRDNDWDLQFLLNKSYFSLMTVLALTILLIWFIMVFYRNNILGPLQLLHEGVRELKLGNMSATVPSTNAPREIFEMTSDFNEMAQSLKLTQSELELAREEALRAAQIKSDFLANMSHEIRTPLNTIVGMADLIGENELSPEKRKYVQVLRNSGHVLLNIVGDILDYSKLEAGQFLLEPVAFDVGELGTRIADVMEVNARVKGLDFKYQAPSGSNPLLMGDANRLEQLLLNLLGNAIKFTEKGSIELLIATKDLGGRTEVEFKIRDTGIGISKDGLNELFKRFSQADNSITRRFGGTGLGLAIVKQIVDLMNGEIDVATETGRGSQFTVNLTFAHAPDQKAASANTVLGAATEAPENASEKLAGRRILLVDDSADNRFLIQTYLKKMTCAIETAEDGQRAVEAFAARSFDIVLMDMQMPVLDGFAATRAIREMEKSKSLKKTPIIALTAFALASELEKTLIAGCDEHLTKPVSKTALVAAIARLL